MRFEVVEFWKRFEKDLIYFQGIKVAESKQKLISLIYILFALRFFAFHLSKG